MNPIEEQNGSREKRDNLFLHLLFGVLLGILSGAIIARLKDLDLAGSTMPLLWGGALGLIAGVYWPPISRKLKLVYEFVLTVLPAPDSNIYIISVKIVRFSGRILVYLVSLPFTIMVIGLQAIGPPSFMINLFEFSNAIGVYLSYFFLYGVFWFLIVRAEIPGNDGLGPVAVAFMGAWYMAAIATAVIFFTLSTSKIFTILMLTLFISLVVLFARWQQQNLDYVPHKLSAYRADAILTSIGRGGLITAAIVFACSKLGWIG